MGKDFSSRNDKGVTMAPVDGPCEAGQTTKAGFPSFAAPPIDGPTEIGMPTNYTESAPTKPVIDGPNTPSPLSPPLGKVSIEK
jgi:hypothetical protein